MTLVLRIENYDKLADGGPVEFRADNRSFEIGRDPYMDWPLPDPERFISSRHCEVRFSDGQYWLNDVSRNGTFVNGHSQRLKGQYQLQDGDRLQIGPYVVSVRIARGQGVFADVGGFGAPAAAPQSDNIWDMGGPAPPPVKPSDIVPPRAPRRRDADFEFGHVDIPPLIEPSPPPRHVPPQAPAYSQPPAAGQSPFGAPQQPYPPQAPPSYPAQSPFGAPPQHPQGYPQAAPPAYPQQQPYPPQASPYPPSPPFGAQQPAPYPSQPPAYPPQQAPYPPAAPRYPQQPPSEFSPAPQYPPQASPLPPPPPPPPVQRPAPPAYEPGQEMQALRPVAPPPPFQPAPPVIEAPRVPAPPPAAPPAPLPQLASARAAPRGSDSGFVEALCAAAGISRDAFAGRSEADIAKEIGEMLRTSVEGLSLLLRARAAGKKLAKTSSRTTMEHSGNNPLKFVPSPSEALEDMLSGRRAGFMRGSEAYREAFEDLKRHEQATWSAMQTALGRVLDGMSPEDIEEKAKAGTFSNKKARAWEIYVERWESRNDKNENGILDVFLVYFSDAYAQIEKAAKTDKPK